MPSDIENGEDAIMGSSSGNEGLPLTDDADGSAEVVEPYVGMEFESDEAARRFYDSYSLRQGFVMRIEHLGRSVTGTLTSRKLVCNKAGFKHSKSQGLKNNRARAITREGCQALLRYRRFKTGKWVVTKFVKEHNHPLVISSAVHRRSIMLSQGPDEKDAKIQELTAELQRERERSAAYLQQLEMVLQDMEEHSGYLSRNIDDIVQSVKGIESSIGANNS